MATCAKNQHNNANTMHAIGTAFPGEGEPELWFSEPSADSHYQVHPEMDKCPRKVPVAQEVQNKLPL